MTASCLVPALRPGIVLLTVAAAFPAQVNANPAHCMRLVAPEERVRIGVAQRYATASVIYSTECFEGGDGARVYALRPRGYRANLVGTELATTGAGLNWGRLNLDVNVSQQQRINASGIRMQRSVGVSLSVAGKF